MTATKELLTIEIEKFGGLWIDEKGIEDGLNNLKSMKSQREALKVKLDFKNKVLCTKCDRSFRNVRITNKISQIALAGNPTKMFDQQNCIT